VNFQEKRDRRNETAAQTADSFNPLPRRYLTDEEGIGGGIKQRSEDFLVDELPLYEPCGAGEHLYLFIETANISHVDLISALAQHFGVKESAIGYAGMKDKHAITRQTISIHVHRDPPSLDVPNDRIKVLWADRHTNKIKRGHLAGNRFSIRIRDVDPAAAPRVDRMLRRLERHGIPSYFGPQRFGYRHNSHILGLAMLKGDWEGLLRELLGATGSPFPEHQRERRELFDQGEYDRALTLWSRSDRSERAALGALCRRWNTRSAVLAVGKTTWIFWISAFQSAVFNRVLDQRIETGRLDQLIEGDLAWKHDVRRVFPVTAEELASGDLTPRLESLEISPSGPLWGMNMIRASGEIDRIELQALEAAGRIVAEAFGSMDVAWGDVHRMRLPGIDLPASGGSGALGEFRVLNFEPGADGRMQVFHGDTYVAVVEFDRPVRARALLTYGNATQAGSPHRTDQLDLYARKELREVWLRRDEIEANTVSRMAPVRP
jgi:tRNA pseudouridine13 synthase